MENFPYEYYFYGSHDSLDEDVVVSIPKEDMPIIQEDRKRFIKALETKYNLPWNATLIVVENGVVTDTIYPKSWVDSINNSLFNTYGFHLSKQKFPNPIKRKLERNILLAVYKCVRTTCAMLTRTHYRTQVKPIIKGCHPFKLKLDFLKTVDYNTVESFNQGNMTDQDVWKVIAFYIGQNYSLIHFGKEIYTKKDLVEYHPNLFNFIYRKKLSKQDFDILNRYLKEWLELVHMYEYDSGKCEGTTLENKGSKIDMKNEITL